MGDILHEFEEFVAEMHLRNIAEMMGFHKRVQAKRLIEAIQFELLPIEGEGIE